MQTFTDENGEVAQDFVQKLKALNSDNSKGDLCIEKCESLLSYFSFLPEVILTAPPLRFASQTSRRPRKLTSSFFDTIR